MKGKRYRRFPVFCPPILYCSVLLIPCPVLSHSLIVDYVSKIVIFAISRFPLFTIEDENRKVNGMGSGWI